MNNRPGLGRSQVLPYAIRGEQEYGICNRYAQYPKRIPWNRRE